MNGGKQEMINPRQGNELTALEEVRGWQQRLVRTVLRTVAAVAPLAIAVAGYNDVIRGIYWTLPIYGTVYAIVLLLAFWIKIPYPVQAGAIIVTFYLMALMDFMSDGRGGSARLFLLMMPFTAGLLLGRRAALFSLGAALLTMGGVAAAMTLRPDLAPASTSSTDLAGWGGNMITWLMIGAYVIASSGYVLPRLISALGESRSLAGELRQQQSKLETQVAERTVDLTRRSGQLAAAAEVAREAAAIQDVERLLAETTQLISQRFGFYHTGIYMLDPTRQYAVLRAASSAGGQRMIARGHRLRVGREGIVGQVTALGEPHIALDARAAAAAGAGVGTDAVFFDNPDLPETRSEIALPLRARGEIMGTLDVQSREPAAFGPEHISVLQILADQVAVAISNARLFEQLQHSLDAERRAYGSLSRKAWQSLTQERAGMERRYDPQRILAESDGWREEMKRAATTAEPAPGHDARWPSMAVPVKVRGEVIGVLDAFKPTPGGEQDVWLDDEVALLEALADQLGAALDGARLYEETQRRANQERLAAEVTARMRETLDVDTVLRTAAQEIRQAMGLSVMTIRLTPTAGASSAPTPFGDRSEAGPTPFGDAGPTPFGDAGPTSESSTGPGNGGHPIEDSPAGDSRCVPVPRDRSGDLPSVGAPSEAEPNQEETSE